MCNKEASGMLQILASVSGVGSLSVAMNFWPQKGMADKHSWGCH